MVGYKPKGTSIEQTKEGLYRITFPDGTMYLVEREDVEATLYDYQLREEGELDYYDDEP